jgi:hypothetical protein
MQDPSPQPSFEWRPVPGQSRGVCARRSFPAGALIDCVPIASPDPVLPVCPSHPGGAPDDCSPANVELRGGPTPNTAAVHALRDITAGEELMVQHGQFVLVTP